MKIFIIIIFVLLGLYNSLLTSIFYMSHDPFFATAFLLLIISISAWFFYKKGFKLSVPLIMVFTILVSLLFTQKLYVIIDGTYLDGTTVIYVNNKRINKKDSKRLKELFASLEEYNATLSSAEPTYTLSYMDTGDLDPRHVHIFKKDNIVKFGSLLGVHKGVTIEGYQLSDEMMDILNKQ